MKLIKYRKGKYQLFTHFFHAYLIILMVPLLISVVIYHLSTRTLKQDAITLAHSVMQNVRSTFEEKKAMVRNIPVRFMEDTKARRFAVEQEIHQEDYYLLNQLARELSIYSLYDHTADDIIVCFNNNDTVLYNGAIYDKEWFFGKYFRYGNYSYDDWAQKLSTPDNGTFYPYESLYLSSIQSQIKCPNSMLYIQTFGDYHSVYGTAVMVLIDEKQIYRSFQTLEHKDDSIFLVLDIDGGILYTNHSDTNISSSDILRNIAENDTGYFQYPFAGIPYTAVYTGSDTGWKYVALIPDQELYAGVEYIEMFSMLFLLGGVGLGVALSVYFSRSNTKPIRDIAAILRHSLDFDQEQYSDIHQIKSGVEQISRKNIFLSRQLTSHTREIRNRILDGFLSGTPNSEEDQKKLIQITKGSGQFQVAIIRLSDATHPNGVLEEQTICELFEQYFSGLELQVLCLHNSDGYVCIFCDHHSRISFLESLEKILTELREEKNILLFVGLGSSVPLERLAISCSEAKIALDECVNNEIITFSESLCQDKPDELFSQKAEKQLITLIQSGDTEKTQKFLDLLQQQNVRRRVQDQELFISGMIIALNRIRMDNKYSAAVSHSFQILPMMRGSPHVWKELKQVALQMCEESTNLREANNSGIISQIEDMILEQYGDSQLSVAHIANQLGITDKYLSRYYKESTGHNLSDTIETIRMKKAEELLRKGLTILQVSDLVGYTSDKSFRRAFKRYYGFVPSDLP